MRFYDETERTALSQFTAPNGGRVVSERRVRCHGTGRTAERWEVVQVWLSIGTVLWRNEGSEDGDTVELVYCRLQDRLLWYGQVRRQQTFSS